MENQEVWLPIKDYEGLYEVSNLGRIKALRKERTLGKHLHLTRFYEEKIMSPTASPNGYLIICLCKNGKPKYGSVHRHVAIAFLPNPDNLPCINHKDTIKVNCKSDNLEWCTFSHNSIHAMENGKMPTLFAKGNKTGVSHKVIDDFGNEYHSIKEAFDINNQGYAYSSFTRLLLLGSHKIIGLKILK